MNIESEAVSKVSEILRRTEYLDPFITENDKTPIWDGFVLVYNSNKHPHRKDCLRGSASVQVKGKKVSNLSDKEIKYSVDVSDLKAFQNDGGAIFFIVCITPAYDTKVFYKMFLPLDLGRILKEASNQKTITIDFSIFPNNKSHVISIFLNFLNNKTKQVGNVDTTKLFLKDWGELATEPFTSGMKMSATAFKDSDRTLFELITSTPQYLYITPKNFEHISIPVDIMENIAISRDMTGPISIRNKQYYYKYKVVWFDGNPNFYFGKGLSISLKRVEGENDSNSYKVRINMSIKGTLQERIKDIEFFIEFYNHKELSINSVKFPMLNRKILEEEKLNGFKGSVAKF